MKKKSITILSANYGLLDNVSAHHQTGCHDEIEKGKKEPRYL